MPLSKSGATASGFESLVGDQDMNEQDSNQKIVDSILQKIASHNIQNPYYSRIKKILDEMLEELSRC